MVRDILLEPHTPQELEDAKKKLNDEQLRYLSYAIRDFEKTKTKHAVPLKEGDLFENTGEKVPKMDSNYLTGWDWSIKSDIEREYRVATERLFFLWTNWYNRARRDIKKDKRILEQSTEGDIIKFTFHGVETKGVYKGRYKHRWYNTEFDLKDIERSLGGVNERFRNGISLSKCENFEVIHLGQLKLL